MERKKFIDMMQQAIYHAGLGSVPDSLTVELDGIRYYPCGYVLTFDKQGNTRHLARLHDLKANSVTECELDKVKG